MIETCRETRPTRQPSHPNPNLTPPLLIRRAPALRQRIQCAQILRNDALLHRQLVVPARVVEGARLPRPEDPAVLLLVARRLRGEPARVPVHVLRRVPVRAALLALVERGAQAPLAHDRRARRAAAVVVARRLRVRLLRLLLVVGPLDVPVVVVRGAVGGLQVLRGVAGAPRVGHVEERELVLGGDGGGGLGGADGALGHRVELRDQGGAVAAVALARLVDDLEHADGAEARVGVDLRRHPAEELGAALVVGVAERGLPEEARVRVVLASVGIAGDLGAGRAVLVDDLGV